MDVADAISQTQTALFAPRRRLIGALAANAKPRMATAKMDKLERQGALYRSTARQHIAFWFAVRALARTVATAYHNIAPLRYGEGGR